jgi:hypothetical protein
MRSGYSTDALEIARICPLRRTNHSETPNAVSIRSKTLFDLSQIKP